MDFFFLSILWVFSLGVGLFLLFIPATGVSWIWERQTNAWEKEKRSVSVLNRLLEYRWLTKPRWLVQKTTNREKLKKNLSLSGDCISLDDFLKLKQLIVTVGSLFLWGYLWFGAFDWNKTLLLIGLWLVVYMIPDLWLRVQIEKRIKKLETEVPYFIDLLALTLQTGMNIEQALRYISDKKKDILSVFVQRQLKLLSLGQSLESVLQMLRDQIKISDWQNFVSSIQQSKKLGVSLLLSPHRVPIKALICRSFKYGFN